MTARSRIGHTMTAGTDDARQGRRVPVPGSGNRRVLEMAAAALAGGRAALGVTAVVTPSLPARLWVGPAGAQPEGRLLGRALGARDLALGAGALLALASGEGVDGAWTWLAVGGFADAVDAAATLAAWPTLPPHGRWLVLAAAGGGAFTGAALCAAVSTADRS